MRKGQKKRVWTSEQKLEIVQKHLDEHMSIRAIEQEYDVSNCLVCIWTKQYLEDGIAGLEPKPRSGNKYAALHTSKKLTELERLRLTVAKQEIEIARLKKGYWVEGVGANKEYVTGQGANMRSLKK